MNTIDYRRIEKISCGGIRISTFLSDDRSEIIVSASDMVEQLSMEVDLDTYGCEVFEAYEIGGRQVKHHCIRHRDINHFLWMHSCKDAYTHDLEEFRSYFMYEVIRYWTRHQYSAASLSIRDAVKAIDSKVVDFQKSIGMSRGRSYTFAIEALGYSTIPIRENLTTSELAFISHIELLYTSMMEGETSTGRSALDSARLVEGRLHSSVGALGKLTRGVS